MTRFRSTAALVVTTLFTLNACQDATTKPLSADTEPALTAATLADPQGAANTVARHIARALGDARLRGSIRAAMHASAWQEDKLVLQDFVRTPGGRELVNAAAAVGAISTNSLSETIDGLPKFDFYVPVKAERSAWTGDGAVLVGAVLDPDAKSVVAYDAAGSSRILNGPDEVPTGTTLIVMHPAEPKFERGRSVVAKTVVPSFTSSASNALSATASASNAAMACVGPVRMEHFNIQEGDGWLGGGVEMEFRSFFGPQLPLPRDAYYVVAANAEEDVGQNPNPPIVVNPNSRCFSDYTMMLYEMDGGINGEDAYGYNVYPPTTFGHDVEYWQNGTKMAYIRLVTP